MRYLSIFVSMLLAAAFIGGTGCSSEDAEEPTAVEGNASAGGDEDGEDLTDDSPDDDGGDDTDTPDDGDDQSTPGVFNAAALGEPCSAADPLTQGDCPDGYTCMAGLQGVDPFCSIACAEPTVCNDGYNGPGVGNCVIGLEVNGTVQSYCGIICQDLTPNDAVCGGQCDGSCPSTMQCSLELQDENMNSVAQVCL